MACRKRTKSGSRTRRKKGFGADAVPSSGSHAGRFSMRTSPSKGEGASMAVDDGPGRARVLNSDYGGGSARHDEGGRNGSRRGYDAGQRCVARPSFRKWDGGAERPRADAVGGVAEAARSRPSGPRTLEVTSEGIRGGPVCRPVRGRRGRTPAECAPAVPAACERRWRRLALRTLRGPADRTLGRDSRHGRVRIRTPGPCGLNPSHRFPSYPSHAPSS